MPEWHPQSICSRNHNPDPNMSLNARNILISLTHFQMRWEQSIIALHFMSSESNIFIQWVIIGDKHPCSTISKRKLIQHVACYSFPCFQVYLQEYYCVTEPVSGSSNHSNHSLESYNSRGFFFYDNSTTVRNVTESHEGAYPSPVTIATVHIIPWASVLMIQQLMAVSLMSLGRQSNLELLNGSWQCYMGKVVTSNNRKWAMALEPHM